MQKQTYGHLNNNNLTLFLLNNVTDVVAHKTMHFKW